MFELWLKRSAGPNETYPLTLTIKQKESRGQVVPVEPFGEVISLAISQRRRWRYIRLALYGDTQPFFKPLYAVAPLSTLREFQVDVKQWDQDGLCHLIGVLCSSPALQSAKFGMELYDSLKANPVLGIVPWDRPTTLGFFFLHLSHFTRILSSSMDTLQHISISMLIYSLPVDGSTPIPDVTMRRLQSMRIRAFKRGSPASVIFDKLTLPSLCELYLPKGFDENSEFQTRGWESLLSLLERLKCKLQAFAFGDDKTPDLIKNLKSPVFKHLTDLRVTSDFARHSDVSLQLLDALGKACEETHGPRMLPLLEMPRLDSVHSVDSVREMVSARISAYGGDGRSKLRRVSAQFNLAESYVNIVMIPLYSYTGVLQAPLLPA
ncbi:hypothetical protein H1R20_g15558, partial [Candolleomyces eurysporus]